MQRRQFMGVPLAAGVAAISTASGLATFSGSAQAAAAAPTDRVNVLDFVPAELRAGVLDGTTTADLTPYIQAAIDTRPGLFLDVQFPTGVYRIKGTLRVLRSHIWLSGENAQIVHDGVGDAIQFGDGTNRLDRIQISGFLFGKSQIATSGAMIRSRLCSTVIVRDCYFYGDDKIFDVMWFERGYMIYVHNVVSEKCRGTHISLSGSGPDGDRLVDITVYDCRFDYGTTALSANGYVEGIFFRRNICLRQSNIIASLNGTAQWTIPSVKLQENDFDGGGSIGVQINRLSNFQINDNWFSSLQDNALRIDAQAAGGTVSGNQFYATVGRTAIEVGGQNVVITGNTLSGGLQGLYLRGSCRNVVFTGNAITYMQGSAVNLYENPGLVTIVGNNFVGNVGGVSSGGTLLNVANNITAAG
ncbi:MAG: right-handed parallel beta-helix repeat-containing protein [Lysobacter sp.]